MGRFLFRRLLQIPPLLVGVTLLTFTIANLVPGSPLPGAVQQASSNDRRASPEDIARVKENLGLDEPVVVRYFIWMGNVLQGDMGLSLRTFTPVTTLIMQKLPNTLLLTGSAFLLSFALAIPIGVYSAVKRNSWFDHTSTAVAVAGYSVPVFWLALMLILLVSVKFREWGLPSLPAGGAVDLRGGGGFLDRLEHLVLPVFTLAFVQIAVWTRFIRSQMLEVLNQDYVTSARAKGLTNRLVIFRHTLRNALLPLITLLGLTVSDLFAGALIIEVIFSFPGMGQLAFSAASNHDYPVIMGGVVFIAVLVVIGNLLADIAYSVLDPRVRLR